MSHVARIDLEIHDLEALAAACEALGLELQRGKTTFKRFFGTGTCEHCIVLPGSSEAYEIGVVRRAEGGGFELALDPWKEGYGILDKVGGEQCPRLRHEYAAAASVREMEAKGYVWDRQTSEKGWTRLTFTRPPQRVRTWQRVGA